MAKQRNFLENIGRFITNADLQDQIKTQGDASRAVRAKKTRRIDLKAQADLKAVRLSNEKRQNELDQAQFDRQLTALNTQVSVAEANIKTFDTVLAEIGETKQPNMVERAQAFDARNQSIRQLVTSRAQIANMMSKQPVPPAQLALRINQAVTGATTEKFQQDAITSEELQRTKMIVELITNDKLGLASLFAKADADAKIKNLKLGVVDMLTLGEIALKAHQKRCNCEI